MDENEGSGPLRVQDLYGPSRTHTQPPTGVGIRTPVTEDTWWEGMRLADEMRWAELEQRRRDEWAREQLGGYRQMERERQGRLTSPEIMRREAEREVTITLPPANSAQGTRYVIQAPTSQQIGRIEFGNDRQVDSNNVRVGGVTGTSGTIGLTGAITGSQGAGVSSIPDSGFSTIGHVKALLSSLVLNHALELNGNMLVSTVTLSADFGEGEILISQDADQIDLSELINNDEEY